MQVSQVTTRGAVVAVVVPLAFLTGSATGPTPATADDTAPPAACSAIDDLDCTGTFTNYHTGDQFCQIVADVTVCHPFWPFRNPVVNAHAAHGVPGAFPDGYEWLRVQAERVETLESRLYRRTRWLELKRERVQRLVVKLHRAWSH